MNLPRDIVCILRLIFDALPKFIRDSKILFKLAKIIFKVPEELYGFRKRYKNGLIKDLNAFYKKTNNFTLERASKNTDINSKHLSIIDKIINKNKKINILDVGCGTGFLLERISLNVSSSKLVGMDFNAPIRKSHKSINNKNKINYISGDINNSLLEIDDNSFDIVFCTHVLEHIINPQNLLLHLRRITKNQLIIICPLEKEYKWGMNYHVNFFPNNELFINFLQSNLSSFVKYKNFKRLGDSMYIEIYN